MPTLPFSIGEVCKELQRKSKVNQVFCLGVVVTVRENAPHPLSPIPLVKVFHEQNLMALQDFSN